MPDIGVESQVPSCPKCGCSSAVRQYDAKADMMILWCGGCGYRHSVPPLDAQSAKDECCQEVNDVFISISVRGTDEVHVSIDKGQED